ncbi:STAS domain-containing protein [Streptomyces sp. NPDC002276]
MPLPQLTVHRHDRRTRALLTLAGEIDLESAPLVRVSLERCLQDGMRAIDVDLTSVTFCDCSGLNTFLRAAQLSKALGGTLRLHHPPTMLLRILDVVGGEFLLLGHPAPPLGDILAAPVPTSTQGSARLVHVLSGDER